MALQTIPGGGLIIPGCPGWASGVPAFASTRIDATGEKVSYIGRFFHKDRGTKTVNKVGFRFGTVSKASGSALTLSLQNVNLASGPPGNPDETQDQTVAIANADAAFASNTWCEKTLGSTRSVAEGELLGMVLEFDGSGRLGADTVDISFLDVQNAAQGGSVISKTGGTWANVPGLPNLVLGCDDGTYGTLIPITGLPEGWGPVSALNTLTYHSGSAADEIAMPFSFPFPVRCNGAWALVRLIADADLDVVLYNGTTAIASASVDGDTVLLTTGSRPTLVRWAPVDLAAGTTYYLAIKPTTANNVSVETFDVNTAAHFQAHAGGQGWSYVDRVDLGAWNSPVGYRRPCCGLVLSAFDDGAGGGGGMLVHPSMSGRMAA